YERVADPARAERDALMVAHLDMARRIALRVARRVPDNVRQDDLIAAAMVGLAEAAERFDAARGQPFVAFAEKRIRGAVLDELRRGDVMSRRARARARQVSDTIRALGARLGRHPEDEEVAAALGVPVDQYLAELETLTHVACVPIDELTAEVAGDDEGPETSAARRLLTARLVAQLQTLPERDATLLSLYYVEELSYAEIGKLFGVTESRVCQLHSRALARLRAGFQEGRDG
ncbi:MAG: FliA/WhiG family RNA polymerase sigma factor, partial [Myxococcales bacterium]|nr:FliA/WhiG family RNA polymerase sigma factor [Myxococcales bacterium]